MMKSVLAMLVVGLSAVSFNAAVAHGGAAPKHGGVVATASDNMPTVNALFIITSISSRMQRTRTGGAARA